MRHNGVITRHRLSQFACLLAIALRALPPSGGTATAAGDSIILLADVKAAMLLPSFLKLADNDLNHFPKWARPFG